MHEGRLLRKDGIDAFTITGCKGIFTLCHGRERLDRNDLHFTTHSKLISHEVPVWKIGSDDCCAPARSLGCQLLKKVKEKDRNSETRLAAGQLLHLNNTWGLQRLQQPVGGCPQDRFLMCLRLWSSQIWETMFLKVRTSGPSRYFEAATSLVCSRLFSADAFCCPVSPAGGGGWWSSWGHTWSPDESSRTSRDPFLVGGRPQNSRNKDNWPEKSAERPSFETMVDKEGQRWFQLDPPRLIRWNRPFEGGSLRCGGAEQSVSQWSQLNRHRV